MHGWMTIESLYQELRLPLDSSSLLFHGVECDICGLLSICVLSECICRQGFDLLMSNLVLLEFTGLVYELQTAGLWRNRSVISFHSVLKWYISSNEECLGDMWIAEGEINAF